MEERRSSITIESKEVRYDMARTVGWDSLPRASVLMASSFGAGTTKDLIGIKKYFGGPN